MGSHKTLRCRNSKRQLSLGARAGLGLGLLVALLSASRSEARERPEDPKQSSYGRDIRPILSDRCFQCHGPDEASRQAGLRLDSLAAASAERDGLWPIVPGNPEASELLKRIGSQDPEQRMPPPSSHKPALSAAEGELLRAWIARGAEYEQHWAFVPPERPAVPETLAPSANAIDRFVFAALQRHALLPSEREQPELLLRRLMLDLTGLPATPEETSAFLAELGQAEFDRVWAAWIERIFTQEPYRSRYAERMASPWLDQARYGDTNGIHTDAGRQIWPWRDWILNAYRENMPFDRFLTEQLAGDLLPEASVEQSIASGFNRNHVITDEGGAIDEEYLVEYAVDRASTSSTVFLGLTMGCARCHDHKFDPISQEEFFGFYAFFNSNDEPGLYSQLPDPRRAFEPALERPSVEQSAQRESLVASLASAHEQLQAPSEADLLRLADFRDLLPGALGLNWVPAKIASAESQGGASMQITAHGNLLVSGTNPSTDVQTIRLNTEGQDLRLIQLDALRHPSFVNGSPGRSENGNGVLTYIEFEAASLLDPTQKQRLEVSWAWADFAQDQDDWSVLRSLDRRHNTGWAIGGHIESRDCSALFLSSEPFGYAGGTELSIKLSYETIWAGSVFGHLGVSLAELPEGGIERLPLSQGAWHHVGPFVLAGEDQAYGLRLGPESSLDFDPSIEFPWRDQTELAWTYQRDYKDGVVVSLAEGVNVHFLGREVYAPQARQLELSLGSDDGFALFVNGELVQQKEVPRGAAPDQDRVAISLHPGRNVIVLKVINTGGQAGFYYRVLEAAECLSSELLAALVRLETMEQPEDRHAERIAHAWRLGESPEYASGLAEIAALEAQATALEAAIPRSMVMRERAEAPQTYVLRRGEYDKADPERPVLPGVPRALGSLPVRADGERATRLDLARWMTARENPLVARVAVNRLWQQVFGRGLVATSADFGSQGSWPSHPELLDWLSVEFIESGWDVQHILTLIMESDTYRQSSRQRPEARALDPENAWLAGFPRRRLDAETIRDQALHLAGLLDERLGGPSVKPYQPAGLWQEVAMPASNTKSFEVGPAAELYRRSVYTYWKRACPPPSLLTFDAPTREACSVQRAVTNTPLQALVLWNDEQFVEAARALAERTLLQAGESAERLAAMFQRCTGHWPDAGELELLQAGLDDFLARYRAAPEDANALLAVGRSPRLLQLDASEVAAWTMLASAILNLHATITQR